jgi:hypothetical protein
MAGCYMPSLVNAVRLKTIGRYLAQSSNTKPYAENGSDTYALVGGQVTSTLGNHTAKTVKIKWRLNE